MVNPTIEYIRWVDSTGDGHWQDKAMAMLIEPHEVVSIGFVLHDAIDFLTIVQSYGTRHDSVDNLLCIPSVAIKERVTLTIEDIWNKQAARIEPMLCPNCGAGVSDCATNGCCEPE